MSARWWLCWANMGWTFAHQVWEQRESELPHSMARNSPAQCISFSLVIIPRKKRKKDCQVSILRFWLKKIGKNETTVCLVTTLWLQLHTVNCDGQCLPAPLKHFQAWFSFLLPHTWSAAVNPLVPSRTELVSTEMSLLELWVGSPSAQPL